MKEKMNIYLLRHGETDWNLEGRLQGHTNIPMNSNGWNQVKINVEVLWEQVPKLDRILSSPLTRAFETAEIAGRRWNIGEGDIIVEPMLIERGFGAAEGLTEWERKEKYPNEVYPGMENFEKLLSRAKTVFDQMRKEATVENMLCVSHGAFLYAMLTAITDGEIEYGGSKTRFDSASVHRIQFIQNRIQIARFDFIRREFVLIY